MLKFKLENASFELLSEAEKTFYKKDGDSYLLQVEGAVDKSKLDEFRASNVELLKQTEKFKDVDLDKYNSAIETERKLRDDELIKKGDIETILAERTAAIQSDFEAKLRASGEQLVGAQSQYSSLVTKYEIDGAASKALTKHKISPDAHDAVMSQIRNKFVIDNGQVVARDGDKILTGANGNLTVDEFVGSQPEIFKVQSNGGGGQGGQGHGEARKFSSNNERITAGLKARLNK